MSKECSYRFFEMRIVKIKANLVLKNLTWIRASFASLLFVSPSVLALLHCHTILLYHIVISHHHASFASLFIVSLESFLYYIVIPFCLIILLYHIVMQVSRLFIVSHSVLTILHWLLYHTVISYCYITSCMDSEPSSNYVLNSLIIFYIQQLSEEFLQR